MSGNRLAVPPALEMTRCLGTVVAFSVISEPVTLNWSLIGDEKELDLRGSHLGPYCYPRAIEAVAEGKVDVNSLISERYPLTEFADAMEAARGGNLKTLLIPH
jgi:threonine dehydrogenase-like Zn-dependent dehydrogenase